MKKVALALASIGLFVSCDDGDLVFDSLNFTSSSIENCNSLYFKINNNELLLIDLTNPSNNEVSVLNPNAPLNQEQILTTNSVNTILYRTYSDKLNKNIICGNIPPANPVVVEEYVSNSGALIKYVRRNNVTFNNNKATVTYNYTINFQNLTLSNGTAEIKYEDYAFGTLVYDTNTLGFNFTNFQNCGSSIISYDSDEELIFNAENTISLPLVAGEINYNLSNSQFITYKLYQGNIVNQNPCDIKTNEIKEDWKAISGSYVIKTNEIVNQITQNVDALKHEFILRNVTFERNGISFTIPELKIQEQTQTL